MPDELFDGILRQAEGLRWASTADVQRRGRQRAHRRTAGAAAACAAGVVAIAGGMLAFTADDRALPPAPPATVPPTVTPSPSPWGSPAPSASPSPGPGGSSAGNPDEERTVEIPPAAMLRPIDLGPGYAAVQPPEFDGDGSLYAITMFCTGAQVRSVGEGVADREAWFRGQDLSVRQVVTRYAGRGAAAEMANVRSWVSRCEPRSGEDPVELRVVASSFAGDDSLLVASGGSRWVLVRQGDLLTEIPLHTGSATDTQARRIGERAAQRLCAGTTAC